MDPKPCPYLDCLACSLRNLAALADTIPHGDGRSAAAIAYAHRLGYSVRNTVNDPDVQLRETWSGRDAGLHTYAGESTGPAFSHTHFYLDGKPCPVCERDARCGDDTG